MTLADDEDTNWTFSGDANCALVIAAFSGTTENLCLCYHLGA